MSDNEIVREAIERSGRSISEQEARKKLEVMYRKNPHTKSASQNDKILALIFKICLGID